MMGNKLASGSRPTSATNDDNTLATSSTIMSVSSDSIAVVETVGSSASQQSLAAMPSSSTHSASVEDEIAVCDEQLEPSPRLQIPADYTGLIRYESSAESTTIKPVPIEVWTEESTVDSSSHRSYNDHDGHDDKDQVCIEDEPMDPSPRPEVDMCITHKPQKLDTDSKPDPSSSWSDYSGTDDKDEPCVNDMPLEPSPRLEVDVHGASKVEERTSVIDEDRDIDTSETSSSDVKVDLLSTDTSQWNGVEKLNVSNSPSALLNGYTDDDLRM